MLELAEERDFLVVEDDYEFEMSFLKPPTHPKPKHNQCKCARDEHIYW